MLIGIDIIDINRVECTIKRTPRFLHRVFTRRELEYCFKKKNPYPSLAARFAAKEAIRKLHPVLASGARFHDVEVINDENGRPEIYLYGSTREKCDLEGIESISLSLSHAKNQAIAAIIASERVRT